MIWRFSIQIWRARSSKEQLESAREYLEKGKMYATEAGPRPKATASCSRRATELRLIGILKKLPVSDRCCFKHCQADMRIIRTRHSAIDVNRDKPPIRSSGRHLKRRCADQIELLRSFRNLVRNEEARNAVHHPSNFFACHGGPRPSVGFPFAAGIADNPDASCNDVAREPSNFPCRVSAGKLFELRWKLESASNRRSLKVSLSYNSKAIGNRPRATEGKAGNAAGQVVFQAET